MEIEKAIRLKTQKEKSKITKQILEKEVYLDSFTKEDLVNTISVAKTNLNELITYCINLEQKNIHNDVHVSMLDSKAFKIDNLVKLFNASNTTNKVLFRENVVEFEKLTHIKRLRLEIEDFNFEIPTIFKIRIFVKDGFVIEQNIIPHNYSGLYSEYFKLPEDVSSIFKVGFKENIYFYNCIFNKEGIQLGTEKEFEKNKDFYFDKSGYLILDRNLIIDKELVVKYQPGENAFEIDVDKMVYKVELICDDNETGYSEKFKKKLVIINE